ncbi:hypothetical protein PENSPDRAFT_683103 [Peniophora sp. CONT]|nr:hypothetical protein PENSPDRAFT_683103 [Peniophora sp. CONT]
MDPHLFKELLVEGPQKSLLDAINFGKGQDCKVMLPLLEAELQRSSARLQRLKEYRNSLASPMYCLQPEILAEIFYTYAHDNDELFNLLWTRLLLVCKRWYNIAKDIQSLWSFIDVTMAQTHSYMRNSHHHSMIESDARDIKRIETQQSRAGLSPLNIKMFVSGSVSEAKLAYCRMFWEPARVKSLEIGGQRLFLDDIIRSMNAHRHPRLESLSLHRVLLPPPEPAGSRELFNIALDSMPSLRRLFIYGVSFDLTLLRGLRSLHIAYYTDVSDPLPFTLQDIAFALGRCPELEILNIALPHDSPDSQPDDIVSCPTVSMVQLRTFMVQSTLSMCTDLLYALTNIPQSATILVTTNSVASAASISPLMSYVGDHASCEGAPAIRSIAISSIALPPQFVPQIAEPDGEIPAQFGMGPPRSRLGIVAQRWPNRFEPGQFRRPFTDESEKSSYIGLESEVLASIEDEFISCVLRPWPLSKATHLDLRSAQMPDTSHIMAALLANLPAATTIIIRPEAKSTRALVTTLRAFLREHGQRAVAHVVFDVQNMKHYGNTWTGLARRLAGGEVLARQFMMGVLAYCAEAARAGVPLDTVEIINEPQLSQSRILDHVGGVDWNELYRDLRIGFVYEGILHSGRRELDGTERDSFKISD